MKKHIMRVVVFSVSYLFVLIALLLIMHIVNSFSPLTPRLLSIETYIVIVVSAVAWMFGFGAAITKKKK